MLNLTLQVLRGSPRQNGVVTHSVGASVPSAHGIILASTTRDPAPAALALFAHIGQRIHRGDVVEAVAPNRVRALQLTAGGTRPRNRTVTDSFIGRCVDERSAAIEAREVHFIAEGAEPALVAAGASAVVLIVVRIRCDYSMIALTAMIEKTGVRVRLTGWWVVLRGDKSGTRKQENHGTQQE